MKTKNLIQKIRYDLFKKRHSFMNTRSDWKQITQFRGCKVFVGPNNKIETVLLKNDGKYDDYNFAVIENIVNPGDVCLDIGANIGVYSMVLAELSGSSQNIHSFEPVRHIRNKLIANAKLNGFKSLHINDFALGAEPGKIDMYQVKEGVFRAGTSTFVENENFQTLDKEHFDVIPVDIKQLDHYVSEQDLTQVDFLKIDVEGFEWNVLQGGQETLKKFKPAIIMEYDFERHNEDHTPDNYRIFLEKNGYKSYEYTIGGGQLVLLPYYFDHTPINRNLLCLHSDMA